MNASIHPPTSGAVAAELAELVERLTARLKARESVDLEELVSEHPAHADELRRLLPAMKLLADLSGSPEAGPATVAQGALALAEPLGDYRIVREIGRGGMGIVYEAVQVSLGRRVALKVLPVEAARDAKLRARFQREARAAAQLHHSNIVPVFEVGQEGNASFYAMQYIQGQSLDQVIQELRQLRAASGGTACRDTASAAGAVARSLLTGQFEPVPSVDATVDAEPEPGKLPPNVGSVADTPTPAALSGQSELSLVESDYRLYCRQVARLGLQVAAALAYAHGRGIVHRDIKPSNLLLDTAGIVWVSDFGLAKTQEQALTETGDLVGTVRYMAPERFGGVCDARADVYALGLTLYELLLLRPAFDAPDRLRLVDQIGHQEPARPRVVDSRIPRDLETILMKAIEKDPQRRYASADDLAEDLRRYLADEPIRARRIGPLERLGRWGRRNPLVASLSAAVVFVTSLGFAGVFGQMQVARANEQQANANAAQAKQERDEVRVLNDRLQRTLYASNMNLAQHTWEAAGGAERVRELLEQHRPKPGESDLRSFEWYYLYRLCHAEILTLRGSTSPPLGVAYSPDGKRLVSFNGGGPTPRELKVWDAQTGQELFTLQGRLDYTMSPDGKRLASLSAGQPGEVKVWDAQTGQELLTFKGPNTAVFNGLALSPDGKRLASATGWNGGEVKVWDAQTGQELFAFKGIGHYLAFSPDGKRLASGRGQLGQPGEVKMWDAQTGQELLTFKGGGAQWVAFSPDSKRLASRDRKQVKLAIES